MKISLVFLFFVLSVIALGQSTYKQKYDSLGKDSLMFTYDKSLINQWDNRFDSLETRVKKLEIEKKLNLTQLVLIVAVIICFGIFGLRFKLFDKFRKNNDL